MSRKIDLSKYTDEELEIMSKKLTINPEKSKYSFKAPDPIYTFEVVENEAYIPFSYDLSLPIPLQKSFSEKKVFFEGKLREEQKEVKNEAISILNKNKSVIISSYTGFGKTLLAIYLATRIGLPTLILCHRLVLIEQWKKSIQKFCPEASIEIITAKSKKIEADFYIINASTVAKRDREFFKDIGLVIVDELHVIMAKNMSQSMKYFTPRYVIGLSATPYRNDGLDDLIDLYFGKEKIYRKLHRKHIVYRLSTKYEPDVKTNVLGKIDWGSVIDSISENEERNELIIRIVKFFSKRNFLILCKRVKQAKKIYERLIEEKEDVTSLIGKQQEYNTESRILVGIAQKMGVGFDHPKLDTLLLATDIQDYFLQYLGRVFRTQSGEPWIFDIVDKFGLLQKHFLERKKIYLEHGGILKDFHESFTNFFDND